LNTAVKPLIWVECIVESHSGSRIEYMLKAKAQFKRRSTANNVEITVPVPEDADSPRFRTNIGSVHYAPEKSAIVWKIKQFGGSKEFLMRAELGLPSVKGDDEHGGGMTGGFGGSMGGVGGKGAKRPISVKFEIPYFTTSGIQVRYLKIIEPKVCWNIIISLVISQHTPHNYYSSSILLFQALSLTFHSSNILPSHGYDTYRRQATTPYDYQT
jgi:AP-1 complex subunit mu